MNRLHSILLIVFSSLLVVACASRPPAPVVNRSPSSTSSQPKSTSKPRPVVIDKNAKTHTVQKGDTLYSLGLKYGYDYKEIAKANNISAPYNIAIGQRLVLPKRADVATNQSGVVITPVETKPVEAPTQTTTPSKVIPVLSEPKVFREPYSVEAMTRKAPKPKPVVVEKPKPVVTPPPEKPKKTQPNQTGNKPQTSAWQWPAKGNVVGQFKVAGNKGIDIAGKKGQSVRASANGKVIYKGSDLRGYGNLVIVKHSKTYLSVYAHNSRILVKEGQFVSAGEKIAEMGDSDTNGVKLHFEIRHKGKSVDPMRYLPQN